MKIFTELVKLNGDNIDIGCPEENIQDAIKFSYELNNKRIRVVKGWHWLDVCFSDKHLSIINLEGLLPSLIICQDLIFDSRLFLTTSGGRVRSSLLQKFHSEYSVFETANSHYILSGIGERKIVPADMIFNI